MTKVLQNVPGVVLYNPYEFFAKSLILIGCHGNRNVKFSRKILKNRFLRSHKGDEAETLHNCLCYYAVHKLCFYCCCACGFIAMETLSFHRFIMGKVKVGVYFCLTLFILTKALQ